MSEKSSKKRHYPSEEFNSHAVDSLLYNQAKRMKLDVDDGVDVIDLRENESPDGGQDVILSPKKGILCQAQQNLNHLFKPMITTEMLKLELIQKKALERKLATDKDTADKAKRAEEKAKAEKDAVQALAKAKKEAEVAAKKELKMIADKCRLKKQEEKDAMEMKKLKTTIIAQQVMKNYFPKKEAKTIVRNASEGIGNVFAFELKKGMSMAPVLRRNKLSGDEYDTFLKSQSATVFLGDCKQSKYKMRSRGKPDKLKYFSFYGDKRPPYYGTFRKTSTKICGRRPFAIENALNYDEDSDEEWGEGDECRSDEETDAESLIGEEDDGGIVAHGYFSDDEIEGSIGNKQSRASVAAKEWQRAHDEKVAKSKVKLMIPMLYGIKYLTEEELCGDLPETLFRGMKLFPYH